METFTPPRPFTAHPGYVRDRERSLRALDEEMAKKAIDPPLLPLLKECIPIPYCFTIQCCFGHFVHRLAPDPENLVPISGIRELVGPIRYRIGYLALCIEDSRNGRSLYRDLAGLAEMDPAFVQFGSADWFWDQIPNTYCLQLEPERMKGDDSGDVTWDEAVRIEELRGPFFERLMEILHRHRAPE